MVYGLNEVNRTVMLKGVFQELADQPHPPAPQGIVQRAVTQQNVIHITEPRALWSFRLPGFRCTASLMTAKSETTSLLTLPPRYRLPPAMFEMIIVFRKLRL
jgi:hypothetical protein